MLDQQTLIQLGKKNFENSNSFQYFEIVYSARLVKLFSETVDKSTTIRVIEKKTTL